jgi:type II secretory ATPase GspE/PulE/Tfp pilus assembly ATPase PilB-like protein
VIMVGEIRDGETAEIAVRAALTGHLLFSTLHTNNAVSAVGRLLDMGIEPFLLASVLEGIMAQRLGRRICQLCKAPEPLPEEVKHRLAPVELAMFRNGQCWRGAGCEKCDGSGFRGRVGYFEVIVTNPQVRQGIAERMSQQGLTKLLNGGFVSMRRDGVQKAALGLTTVEEVLRATQDADETL